MKQKKRAPWIQAELKALTIERQRVRLLLSLETARGMRLKNDRLERSLIRKEDVQKYRAECVAQVLDRLSSLPEEIADGCPAEIHEPVRKTVAEYVHRAKAELIVEN